MILSILLQGLWDIVFNILITLRDIDYLGKLIMGIFDSLRDICMFTYKGYLPVYFKVLRDIWYPLYKPQFRAICF